MELKEKDTKNRVISLISTIVFHILVVVLLMAIGLKYPDPPPPELGVEMDMGSLTDYGNAFAGELGGSDAANPIHEVPNSEDDIISQDTEDSPITSKKTDKKTTKENIKTEKPKETQEAINPNALFQKGKVKNTGSGEGEGKGSGRGDGEDGGGGTGNDNTGSGTSFSLKGRGAKSLSLPSSRTNDVGSVVVTITVDREGNVIRAVAGARGTTIDNKSLWRHCEYAASQSKFSANPNATFEQKGTITYKFQR